MMKCNHHVFMNNKEYYMDLSVRICHHGSFLRWLMMVVFQPLLQHFIVSSTMLIQHWEILGLIVNLIGAYLPIRVGVSMSKKLSTI